MVVLRRAGRPRRALLLGCLLAMVSHPFEVTRAAGRPRPIVPAVARMVDGPTRFAVGRLPAVFWPI